MKFHRHCRCSIMSVQHTCPMVPCTVPTTFWYGRVTPAVPGLSQDSFTLPCYQSIPDRQSYTGSPGLSWDDYPTPRTPLAEYPRIPELHRQSRDDYPTLGTPLAEYPRTPELHRQSQDCPGMATQPLCQNARVTPAVLGLSRDDYPTHGTPLSEYPRTLELPGMATQPLGPLWQSIPERRSYTGSPGIVPGWLPNHSVRTPELYQQS